MNSEKSHQWLPSGKKRAGRVSGSDYKGGTRKLFGVLDVFINLIVATISQMYKWKTSKVYSLIMFVRQLYFNKAIQKKQREKGKTIFFHVIDLYVSLSPLVIQMLMWPDCLPTNKNEGLKN